ncbi:unnamed protein product [Calicophoron daubneyi]|uniref:Uncharacterized protein n=1 Tax=Calicophoron daubneyi TaxID=300641 RepID=A0AAV2U1P1_CALDB
MPPAPRHTAATMPNDYEAHANAVFDVKWLSSGAAFLTASGDQSVRLVDAERGILLQQFLGHTMSVRSLSLMPSDSQIFASASRDGSIRLWDIRLKSDTVNFRGIPGASSVGLLSQCHLPDWPARANSDGSPTRRPRTISRRLPTDAQSVTSVVFMNDSTLISAGSTDGSIKMWDLRRVFSASSRKKAKPKTVLPYRGVSQKRSGYSDLQLDSLRTRLYANCLDNVVYEYDLTQSLRTSPIFVYAGHQTDSFYIKLDISPDDHHIICGSSDRRAHIYSVGRERQRPVVLSGHTGEVSVPRWCKSDPSRVITLSDDSRAFVWNMFPARYGLMPQPGELAGLAERLSPSEAIMSPSYQEKRIIRSPPTLPQSGVRPLSASLSLTCAKRRQSNIRNFLKAISSSQAKPGLRSPVRQIHTPSVRSRNPVTLTETLGGVVQRFPGASVGLQPSVASPGTPPFGCYSAPLNEDMPSTPVSASSRRIFKPTTPYSDDSDTENLSPLRPMQPIPTYLPLDCFEGSVLTKSPVICCTNDRLSSSPQTPRAGTPKRTPLALHQTPFSSPCEEVVKQFTERPRKRMQSPFIPDSVPLRDDLKANTDKQFLKRRRLTVYSTSDRAPASPLTGSPGTPTNLRRRRMTVLGPASANPITRYFKRDD